jgi:hypothetical protein
MATALVESNSIYRLESAPGSNRGFESLPVDIPQNRHRAALASRHSDCGCMPKSWSDVSTGALFEMELDTEEPSSLSCGCSPENIFTISLKELSIEEDMAYQGSGFPARRESTKLLRNQRDLSSQDTHTSRANMSSGIGIPKEKRSSRRSASSM